MDKLIRRIFRQKEILFAENFYTFIEKKKVVVFVPSKFLEKLALEMSKAGAGTIGNYEMCSFRTEGTGTYKPNEKAKPFAGKKNALSYSDEIKLEMECDARNLNGVINVLLKNHPYEEVAYEVYDFRKRGLKVSGFTVELKSAMQYSELLKRLNKKIKSDVSSMNYEFKKIVLTSLDVTNKILESSKFIEAECLLLFSKNNYKLFKI